MNEVILEFHSPKKERFLNSLLVKLTTEALLWELSDFN